MIRKFLRRLFFGREKSIGICSGYFLCGPHYGHIEYLNAAKNRCDFLIVIVNNDEQVKLKGSVPFMDRFHRANIINNLKCVDKTIIALDKTKNVCETLKVLRNVYKNNEVSFFNSGDRCGQNLESAEMKICKELGIKYTVIELPKIFSSSKLIADACAHS